MKPRGPRRIRHWLFLLAVAATLPFAILTVIQFVTEFKAVRERAEQGSLKEAQAIAIRLVGERTAARTMLEQLANRPGIQNPQVQINCGFASFRQSVPHYANIALYDLSGTPICSAVPWTPGSTVAGMKWFEQIKRTGQPLASEPELSPILHDWVVFHAHPVFDERRTLETFLVVPVLASRYRELLKTHSLPANAMATLIDGDGTIIARTLDHEKWVGKRPTGAEAIRLTLASNDATFRGRGVEGVDRVYGVARGEQGWRVLVGVPSSVVFAPLRRFIVVQSAILTALFAAFVVLSTFVARRIEQPVVGLANRTRHLMSPGTVGTLPEEGPAEIAGLARSINEMLEVRAERERLNALIIESTADGIWMTGRTGEVTFMNSRAAEMLGRPAADLLGSPLATNFTGEARSAVEALLQTCRTGQIARSDLDVPKNGQDARWLLSASPLYDASGNFAGSIITTTDATAHHRAEMLVRESEARLLSIFSSAMDAIITADEHQRIVMFNAAAEAMFGITRAQVQGQPLSTLMPERFRSQHSSHVEHFGNAHETQRGMGSLGAVYGLRANGEEFPIEASISHVRVDGRHLYSVILRDISKRLEAERAIRESESRLAVALESSGAAAWNIDVRKGEVHFDESYSTMLDLPRHPPVRKMDELLALIHPDDLERAVAALDVVMAGPNDRLDLELRQITASGRPIWVVVSARVVERDEQGVATRIVGSSRDLTDSKRSQFRLEQETEFNRNLVNASPAFFLAFDPSGKIIVINDALLYALGYERDELLDRHFDSIVPAHGLDEANRAFRVLAESLEAIALEISLQTRDGREIVVEWRARPVLSETGAVDFVFAIGLDVGERRKEELARERYAELLAAVNETAITLLSHHDVEETLQMIAARAAALTGAAGSFVELCDPETGVMRVVAATGISSPYIGRVVEHGQGLVGTVHATGQATIVEDLQQWPGRPSGSIDIHAAAGVPILSGLEVVGVLGISESDPDRRISAEQTELLKRLAQLSSIAIDNARLIADAKREVGERARAEAEVRSLNAGLEVRVQERTIQLQNEVTERKKAEEELRQRGAELAAMNLELAAGARMKDEFLANMSHELRTPLNAILGMAEVLREEIHGPLNSNQNESLEVVTQSGTHLLELINDVLDLSKVEAGKVELEVHPVDVRGVAEGSLQMVREPAFRKQLTLTLDIDPTVESVDADERRLKQILMNLLSNAVKFTPHGGSVGLGVDGDSEGNTVRFTVWDTGIGVPESQLTRLFTPFFQADSGYTRQYSGTGLGLSLVRRFAALHGGSVDVESTVGVGSRFSVTLPWRHIDVLARPDDVVFPRLGGSVEGPVLIVEDDPTAAAQIARYIGELGLQAVLSDGTEEPLELAMRIRPSTIILDLLFQSTSGWQILAILKASPETAEIPVLIVSVVDDAARGLAMGAAGYLLKPVSREGLESALARVMTIPRETSGQTHPLILIAEDNETNIRLMESYLGTLEVRIIVARDGAAAVAIARERLPDLILMDVQMPVLDGLEATRLIRGLEGPISQVPIIALTALAMSGDRDRCLAAGANDYLTKPVSLRTLTDAISRSIRRE